MNPDVLVVGRSDVLAATAGDRRVDPLRIPAVVGSVRAQLLRGKVLHAVDRGRSLEIRRRIRDEKVLVEVERADDRAGFLTADDRHGGLAGLLQFPDHLLRLLGRTGVEFLEQRRQSLRKRRIRQHDGDIRLRKLHLKVGQLQRQQRFLAGDLPELAGGGDTFLAEVVSEQFNLTVDLRNLRLHQPLHEIADDLGAFEVIAFDWHRHQLRFAESHAQHRHLGVDRLVGQENPQVGRAIPWGRISLRALARVLAAVGRLAVPQRVTCVVVFTTLVNVRLKVGQAKLKVTLERAIIRPRFTHGSLLEAGVGRCRIRIGADVGTHRRTVGVRFSKVKRPMSNLFCV